MAEKNHLPINSIRAHLVIAKALAYAVAMIDSLPSEKQEWSDRQDMVDILKTHFTMWGPFVAQSVEFHTGHKPDLTDYKNVEKQ